MGKYVQIYTVYILHKQSHQSIWEEKTKAVVVDALYCMMLLLYPSVGL